MGSHPKLVECLIEILERSDQLDDEQVLGLLAAAIVLGKTVWGCAVKMLSVVTLLKRESVLSSFEIYLRKQYRE